MGRTPLSRGDGLAVRCDEAPKRKLDRRPTPDILEIDPNGSRLRLGLQLGRQLELELIEFCILFSMIRIINQANVELIDT